MKKTTQKKEKKMRVKIKNRKELEKIAIDSVGTSRMWNKINFFSDGTWNENSHGNQHPKTFVNCDVSYLNRIHSPEKTKHQNFISILNKIESVMKMVT